MKTTILIILLCIIALASYAVTRPKAPEYVTALSVRGDLRHIVEAVGTVTSEKDLDLQFAAIDVVAAVYVKEGDRVLAGAKLASLRSGTLAAGVASAHASVQSAQAALRALEEGMRPEDRAIIQAQLENKRASLAAALQTVQSAEANLVGAEAELKSLEREAGTALSGEVLAAAGTVSQQTAIAKTAVQVLRGVFNANDVQDSLLKSAVSSYDPISRAMTTSLEMISAVQAQASPADYADALALFASARAAVWSAADVVSRSYDLVSSLPLTVFFTNTSRETSKTTIAAQKALVQSALTAIDTSLRSLQDASASYDSRITAARSQVTSLQGTRDRAKADITTFETSVKINEAELQKALAPARQTDIDAARARVRQAQADLSRASSLFQDTILFAPVSGVITKVNVKTGEVRPSVEASISMLGDTPLRVDMFLSEIDVPPVHAGQTGSITLDAYKDQRFLLRVMDVDAAATDTDGVPKYRARLSFLEPVEGLRVGMTGDAEIETDRRADVVSVPLRSIVEDGGRTFVRVLEDGKVLEVPVVTGMEGEGDSVEVQGLEEGRSVIVLTKSS